MAAAIAASFLLDLTVTLLAAPAVSNTLGAAVLLTSDTLDGGGAGTYLPFTSSTDVADALAASKIVSGTAAALNVALGQDKRPSAIYVVTYGAGDPYAGLTLAIEAGLDVGAFVLATTSEAVLETCATAYAADSRRSRMVMIAQSADTDLYGVGKPASLDALEQATIKVDYSGDTDYLAAARLGRLCGQDLTTGLPGATFRPLSVAPPTITNAQVVLLKDNDSGCCLKQNYGATATERITVGDLSVDVPAHDARLRGRSVPLTGLEFDLLVALARRAGRGDTLVGERAVDVHVSHLRQKLGDDPRAPRLIKTVRGVGYLLVKP